MPSRRPCYQLEMDTNQDTPNSPALAENRPQVLSPRQIAARRANAKKCTGPRTSDGKAAARFNALKHGFFACDIVNRELDGSARAAEFNSMLDALLEDFQPQSARERILVDEVAASCWRIRRLLRYECRESWADEDAYRRDAESERPSDSLLASMGYDHHGTRLRTAQRLQRSGLDSFILPSMEDVDKIVRFERMVKRSLYRALYMLEHIQAARGCPKPSDETSSSQR
jgi:hypothetical protein